jgi:hypothetical protein
MDLKEIGRKVWTGVVVQSTEVYWRALVNTVMNFEFHKRRDFHD